MSANTVRVQTWVNGVQIQMYVSDCPECGVVYGITRDYELRRRDDGRNFSCPNGHRGSFGESEIDKAKRMQAAAESQTRLARISRDAARDQAAAAERSARAYRGQVTRMKNKIAAGVCPVGNCRRHFDNVQAHILTQHSAWAGEHPEALT